MGIFAPTLVFFDCLSEAHCVVDKTPFKNGSGPDCDWRIDDYSVAEEHCAIQRKGREFYLLAFRCTDAVLLDGVANAGANWLPMWITPWSSAVIFSRCMDRAMRRNGCGG